MLPHIATQSTFCQEPHVVDSLNNVRPPQLVAPREVLQGTFVELKSSSCWR